MKTRAFYKSYLQWRHPAANDSLAGATEVDKVSPELVVQSEGETASVDDQGHFCPVLNGAFLCVVGNSASSGVLGCLVNDHIHFAGGVCQKATRVANIDGSLLFVTSEHPYLQIQSQNETVVSCRR